MIQKSQPVMLNCEVQENQSIQKICLREPSGEKVQVPVNARLKAI